MKRNKKTCELLFSSVFFFFSYLSDRAGLTTRTEYDILYGSAESAKKVTRVEASEREKAKKNQLWRITLLFGRWNGKIYTSKWHLQNEKNEGKKIRKIFLFKLGTRLFFFLRVAESKSQINHKNIRGIFFLLKAFPREIANRTEEHILLPNGTEKIGSLTGFSVGFHTFGARSGTRLSHLNEGCDSIPGIRKTSKPAKKKSILTTKPRKTKKWIIQILTFLRFK